MADNTARFVSEFDDSQIERSMLALADQLDKLQAEFDALSTSGTTAFKDINQAAAKGEEEIKQYNKQLDETADKTKKAEQETGRFGRGLKALFGNLSVGGVSLNDLSDGLQNVKGGLSDVASGSGKAAQGFGVLRGGALALVAVVGAALVAAFSKFQNNLDSVRVGLAQGKVALDVGITALGKWGNQLIAAATGQKSLRDAIQDARSETAGLNAEIRRQIELEGRLEKQRIGLERQAQEQAAFASLQKQEIERLNLIADNTTKSFAVREAAAKKRQALSEQIGKAEEKRLLTEIALTARINGGQEQQIKTARTIAQLAKENALTTENLANRIAKTGVSQADAFKRATEIFGIIGELGDAQESLLGIQSEAFNQAQSIRAEQAQAAAARKKELEDAAKQLQDLVNATAEARAKFGDENDQIQLSYANATAEVEKLKIEYTKLAKLIGTGETADDINALFEPLQRIADIDFEKASFGQSLEVVTTGLDRLLKIATDPLTGNISDLVSSQTAKPLAERLRADGLEAGKALGAAVAQGAKLEAARQREQGNELAKQLIGNLAPDAINAFFEAEQAQFELRIARQDALIAKNQERLDEAKRALDEEKKLDEQGLANGLKDAEKKVKEEERLLREGEARKIEIERRAAKQRAIIAAGQQAVELTLSVAKLISAQASGGLVGLVLALGGISIISRIMAASRAQAASEAGKTAAYATGTEYVEGAGTETSDSINAMLSRGERVMTAKDNRKLGGRKLKNEDLVKYALIGQRFADTPLLDYALSLKGRAEQYEAMKLELQFDAMRTAYRDAAMAAADKQIEYWKSRPIEYLDSDGNTVREWSNGSGVVRQVITQNENISIN